MKESYGELILTKGSILYCSSCYTYDEIIKKRNIIPFLYYVFFRPNELDESLNLYKITLKKDISLFFDIEFSNSTYPLLRSPLKYIINNIDMNEKLSINLKKHNFDGYFGTRFNISDKVQITLFNNENIFNIENEYYNTNMVYNNEYNLKYSPCFIENKSIMNINKRYEEDIQKYMNYIKNKKDIHNYININLYLLIEYSVINYHNGEKKDLINIFI